MQRQVRIEEPESPELEELKKYPAGNGAGEDVGNRRGDQKRGGDPKIESRGSPPLGMAAQIHRTDDSSLPPATFVAMP
jgi:hypothetical protein